MKTVASSTKVLATERSPGNGKVFTRCQNDSAGDAETTSGSAFQILVTWIMCFSLSLSLSLAMKVYIIFILKLSPVENFANCNSEFLTTFIDCSFTQIIIVDCCFRI